MSVDMDKRSSIKNLCPWAISFKLENSRGDVFLEAGKKTTINNQEIVTLCENGNVMFVGTDNGNHARVYIENSELRKYVGFDSEDGKKKQIILDDETCQKILDYKTLSTFKQNIEKTIVGDHEKHIIMDYARKIKLNDFDKISILEDYTGLKFRVKE